MIGRIVSHYEILEEIGGGGMGIVYKARDTRLDRLVALKFLPIEWSRDADARERFTREAKAASAIDHPNICTVYDVGETDEGRMFIAMAYYPGQTLNRRIQQGALPMELARGSGCRARGRDRPSRHQTGEHSARQPTTGQGCGFRTCQVGG